MVSLKNFRPKDKESLSDLQSLRACYIPRLPTVLQASTVNVVLGEESSTSDPCDVTAVQRSYPLTFGQPVVSLGAVTSGTPAEKSPLRIGIVFCGRQSPGGHNIVTGLFDALKSHHADTTLLGFIDGTEGLLRQDTLEITADLLELYRNQGGYDLLGRTRDQIRSVQQIQKAHSACEALQLDGLVLIGGCQTCSDAAQLAESFKASGLKTKVVAVPVTIDGDLRNYFVEANVGFDTACKVYSQLISNICTDALSAEKYYYFIRLMGRHTSHVTLECALQSQPNLVILGEEVATSKSTLFDITKHICDMITLRSEQGKHHGVVLLPEGLFNSIPEAHALLQEMNELLKQGVAPEGIPTKLSPWAAALFEFLPSYIRKQLLLDRESDGSVRLSQIETEKLFVQLVETEMSRRTRAGVYKGKKFNGISYFFGYQARGSLPSNFDCDYAYTLGHVASHLLGAGLTGYLATVSNLKEEPVLWQCGGVPITALMAVKRWLRGPEVSEIGKPLVHPAKVDLKGKPYELFSERASMWIRNDFYRNPGPLQFSGAACDMRTITLQVEEHDYLGRIEKLRQGLAQVRDLVRPGCPPEALSVALTSTAALLLVLSVITSPAYRSQTPF